MSLIHAPFSQKVMQAPVPALEAESDRLTAWLRYGISAAATASASGGGPAVTSAVGGVTGLPSSVSGGAGGSGAAYVPSSWVSMNPDFQQVSVIPLAEAPLHLVCILYSNLPHPPLHTPPPPVRLACL